MMAGSWLAKPPSGAAAIDPRRPCRQRQQARSLGGCGMHDDRCYVAELYLMLRYFSALWALRARGIKFLNARAR